MKIINFIKDNKYMIMLTIATVVAFYSATAWKIDGERCDEIKGSTCSTDEVVAFRKEGK